MSSRRTAFLAATLAATSILPMSAQENRIALGASGLSVVLPSHWRRSDQADHRGEGTFGAFQSQDRTSSWFLSEAKADSQADMSSIMEGVVKNFESAFRVNRIGEMRNGTLADSVAVFTTLEAELRSATNSDTIPFRFYLAVLDTGESLYLIQASVQAPVKPEREKEVLAMMRSLRRIAR